MTTIDEDLDLRERMLIQAETLTDIARVLRPMFEQT